MKNHPNEEHALWRGSRRYGVAQLGSIASGSTLRFKL
jgi:hypothetical protein